LARLILPVAAALALLMQVLTLWPHASALLVVVIALWMVFPGVICARQFLQCSDSSGVAAWLVGPALGLGLSVFGSALWWLAGVQNWAAILVGPILPLLLALGLRRVGAPLLRLPALTTADLRTASALVLLVPLITWAPYDHVREPVPDGEAYRAYFTADFVWALTVVSEVAKGDVPPVNPFLREQPLHYYWMAHFLSGEVYRNLAGLGLTTESVVLIDGLLFSAAFVLFFYFLARTVGASRGASAVAVFCAFCANSYEGADMVRAILTGHAPWAELANTNIDAITRWFYKGMAVDGLQRLFLYQPHHLTGYMLALAALWLVAHADDVTTVGVAVTSGCLLALALLFSTFGGLIVSLAVGMVYALRLVQQRALASAWQCVMLSGGPVLVGVVAVSVLGYTDDRYGSLLQLGLNPVATHDAVRVWILSFGPLLFGTIAALALGRWLNRDGAAPVALIVSSTAFYFFTNVPDSGDVWVGWRSGHMLLIAFAAATAAWLTHAWQHRSSRIWLGSVCLILVLPAVPTVAVDVYNAQDVTNRTKGADFPWTLVITPEEREALDWVRTSTPPDAVVQVEPEARGAVHWSYIGAFAERRMAAGLPVSMTPYRPYELASDEVQWGVFRTTQSADGHASARSLGIDYIFIGYPERRLYRPAIVAMESDPALFPVVFKNRAVTILRVAPVGPPPPHDKVTRVGR
jgi:hypothetical protein